MKCIKCNSEIPDGSVMCPVCNSNLSESINTSNTVPIDTSVLPTVPENPVLPANQGMNQASEVNNPTPVVSQPENSGVTETVVPQNTNVLGADARVLNNGTAPVVENVGTSNNGNINPQASVAQENVNNGNNAVIEQNSAMVQSPVVNDINPEYINPNGDSIKLGNTKSPEDNKAKKKKNLIIILIIVGVLLVAGVGFFLYYSSQYKSADKRIDAIVSALTMKTKSLKNDAIDKSSGTYDIGMSISSPDQSLSFKVDGTYAVDLSGKAMDYTVNLTSLNLGEELIDNPVNLEFYLNESRVYVLLQNYFDSYVYDEVPGLDTIFQVNEQNNIDYVSMINALKSALASGIKRMSNTQTVGDANINGKTKKANIIKINFNERNRSVFFKTFLTSLANNKKFVSEGSKFADLTEDEFKNKLEETANDESIIKDMSDINIEIYTAQFGDELYGIKLSDTDGDKKGVIEFYPTAKGFGISFKEGSQSVLDLTYESASKKTSTTNENETKLTAVFYNEGQAYNISLECKTVGDVNPKDAKVNVKNSINKKYLTEEQKQMILQASQDAGKIGLYLPSILSLYLNDGVSVPSADPSQDSSWGDISITTPEGGYQVTENDITGITDCTENPSLCA